MNNRGRRMMQYAVMGFLLIVFGVFLLLPIFVVAAQGLHWAYFVEIFRSDVYREGLLNSLGIAVVTTAMVVAIALPLALLYDRFDFAGKDCCAALIMIPMILPPFVGALGFQQILGHFGVLNVLLARWGLGPIDFLGGEARFYSVCLIEALHLYPILYLNLVTALGNIDPALDEAAANLGASRFYRLRRVTLPLLKPGLLAGGSIVLIWSFTELGTPLMFGLTRTTPVQIFNGLTELESNPVPYALVLLLLIVAGALYFLARYLLNSSGESRAVKGMTGTRGFPTAGWKKVAVPSVFGLVTLIAALPHIALILSAFGTEWYGSILPRAFTLLHFENALSNKIVLPSIVNSLNYSLLAMVLACGFGLVAAILIARWKLRGGFLIDQLSMLPLAVPGIVMAFGFLAMAARFRFFREWFDPMENPLLLLGAAYAIRRLPYVVRSVVSGLEQTPRELEEAARNLGAGTWTTLRRVTLPLLTGNLIVGGLFAFSFSMLEVSDSLMLAQRAQDYPITKAIFDLSQILGSGPLIACAFGVWAMLFLGASLMAASVILGRRVGAIFRF